MTSSVDEGPPRCIIFMKRIFVIFAVVLLAIAQGDPTFTAGGNVAP